MTDVLFTFAINDFEVRPKLRKTKGDARLAKMPEHKVSLKYIKRWRILQSYNAHSIDFIHRLALAWRKKDPLKGHMIISWAVHLPHMRGVDSDNIDKQIRDCMKKAGIIVDDKLVRGTDKTRLWQKPKGPARIAVTLKRLTEAS